jgi:ketopantoate reductase
VPVPDFQAESALARMQVFDRAALVEIELVTAVSQRIWAPLMVLAPLDLAVTRCAPAAIEETAALGAQVQEVLAPGTEEVEAFVLEVAVAGADVKKDSRSRKQ